MSDNKPFEPFEVDLTYKHEPIVEETFQPIVVDMTYPPVKVSIDSKLSVMDRLCSTLTEWGDKFDVSILYSPRNLRDDRVSLVPLPSKLDAFLNRLN